MQATTAPTPIPLRDLRLAGIVGLLMLFVLYMVSFDQGAVSQAGLWLHEVMHDGRHLFGFPCH